MIEIFFNALQKARDEGNIDSHLLAWDQRGTTKAPVGFMRDPKLQLPPQLKHLPNDVLYDFQKTIENIRLVAESHNIQVIGTTSPVPQQGTSSLAAIMALILAAREKPHMEHNDQINGKKNSSRLLGALIMDAQFRHPSLHRKLGISHQGGLVEILEGELPFNEGIKPLDFSYLKMITAGNPLKFHLNQNHLEKLKAMLSVLKRKVEFIVLDIPALLYFAEGITLSKLCDGVILVVRAAETRWQVVLQARRMLEKAQVPILGGILNRREFYIPDWAYKGI
jgi:Mrp family chromosome partitioning ATPase